MIDPSAVYTEAREITCSRSYKLIQIHSIKSTKMAET